MALRKKPESKEKKKTPSPAAQARQSGMGRLLDKGSFFSGLASGLIVIGVLLVFAYLSAQPVEPGATQLPQGPNATAPKPEPQGLQVMVKNTNNQTVLIRGGDGSGFPNKTKELKPGEVATVDVATPKGCGTDVSQCWQTLEVTYYVPQGSGGLGENGSSGGMQNGSSGGNGTGNVTGNGTGETPPPGQEPLAIITSSLPPAMQDAKYSFALEAAGGMGSGYGWTASGLPLGLIMAQNGMILGASLEKGTFTVDVVVYDGQYSAYKSLSLVVN